MKKITLVVAALLLLTSLASAEDAACRNPVVVYLFWSQGCPHCAAEKPFLERLEAELPCLTVNYLEVSASPENAELYSQLAEACGENPLGVPATFIGRDMVLGYDDDEHVGAEIRAKIMDCSAKGCVDTMALLRPAGGTCENSTLSDLRNNTVVNLPFLGSVDPSKMSLPLFTIVLGGLDSFNPCAFFVLFFLLSLLIHARSRARMFIIGGVFVFFSGLIYFIFMAAWLNLFLHIGELKFITLLAGLTALAVAVLNVKDFFWFKQGLSLSIPESAKPKLFTRMRNLVKATALPTMVFGTAVLAIAANTYELLCTAGFPLVYTRVLTLNHLSAAGYYLYLALYNVVYVTPLFAIVLMFTLTLGSRKLKEEEGRILKLLSGLMMLFLGLLLVFAPEMLNNVAAAVAMLFLAVAVTVLVVFVTRAGGTKSKRRKAA